MSPLKFHVKFIVGNCISFGFGIMCDVGMNRLKISFPDPHILAVNKQAIVAQHMYWLNDTVH